MARQVRISDSIKFTGDASTGRASGKDGNVDGKMNLSYYTKVYDFDDKAIDTTNDWTTHVGNGGAVAISAAANGMVRLTANAGVDDNCAEFIGQAVYYAQQECSIEVRLKVDNITTVGIAVGLFDNAINTNDQIKCEISGATIVDRGTTPDFVGFCFDTDATDTDYWYMVNTKAGVQAGTSVAIAPVNAAYEVLRVDLDASGNAAFYRNGVPVGAKASAITVGTALAPYAGLITRVNGARNLDIDYFKVWQKRPETSSILA